MGRSTAPIVRLKGSELIKSARYAAERYLRNCYPATEVSCRQFLRLTENHRSVDGGLDKAWEWIRKLPQPKGKIEETDIGWQMMCFTLVMGSMYGLTGMNEQTLVCIPRKQGKTSFAAKLALGVMHFTDEPAAKVYSLATNKEQATLVFKDAQTILRKDTGNIDSYDIKDTGHRRKTEITGEFRLLRHSIELWKDPGTEWVPMASESKNLDGLFPSFVILDEAALIKDDVYNVVDSASNEAVAYQHVLAISTANKESDLWFPTYLRDSIRMEQRGEEAPFNILAWMPPEDEHGACLLESKDRGKVGVWKKLNPSFGITLGKEFLEDKWKKARMNTATMIEFRRKRLNEWGIGGRDQMLSPAEARAMCNEQHDAFVEEMLKKSPTAIGVDLAMVNDLVGVAVVGYSQEGMLVAKVRGFLSERSYDNRVGSRSGKVFEKFRDEDAITVVGKEAHDWKKIKEYMGELVEEYEPDQMWADKMTKGTKLADLMKYDFHIPCNDFTGKEIRTKGCNYFFDNILQKQYRFTDSSWLRWELQNSYIKEFPDGGVQIVRPTDSSRLGIDGVYAVIHGSVAFADYKPNFFSDDPETFQKQLENLF